VWTHCCSIFTICNIIEVRKIPLYLESFISSFHLHFVLGTCKKKQMKILLIILHYLQLIPRNSIIDENRGRSDRWWRRMNIPVYFPVACLVLCYVKYTRTFLQMAFVVAHFKKLTRKYTIEYRQSVACETQNRSWRVVWFLSNLPGGQSWLTAVYILIKETVASFKKQPLITALKYPNGTPV